jgi:hypothetical protein
LSGAGFRPMIVGGAKESVMLKSSNDLRQTKGHRCIVCCGKFGLIRYYTRGKGVCSRKCRERLRMRRANTIKWLFTAEAV